MIYKIKVENNSRQILRYLEILGYKWQSGDRPTEFYPIMLHNCFVADDMVISYSVEDVTISFEEFKRQNPIQKKHLRSGMVVELINRQRCLVINFMGELLLISDVGCCYSLSGYREDLTCLFYELSIDKVFIVSAGHLACMLSKNNSDVQIWERPKEEVELTMDEIAEKFNIDVKQLKIKK